MHSRGSYSSLEWGTRLKGICVNGGKPKQNLSKRTPHRGSLLARLGANWWEKFPKTGAAN
ncbi:hypothetical protein LR48_Vigan2368s000100 [Vigna angularis]|nr:hypothetical protein LR48_Vigan2368s000100 [Vigna angularis]